LLYKKNYDFLSFVQKAELYGIVMLCYIFFAIFYDKFYFNQENKVEKSTPIISNTVVQKKAKHLSDIELVSYFENRSIQFTLEILDMKFTKKTIILEVMGSFINVIHFLEHIQENFVISKCEIEKGKKELVLNLIINTQKYFEEEELVFSNIPNPFLETKKRKKKDTSIKIEAIIAGEVLIEGDWYKKGDHIKGFIVSKISDSEVLFVQKYTHIHLKKEITNE